MADIRIVPATSVMSFTSSLNFKETLTQDASGSIILQGSGSTGRVDLFAVNGTNGRLFTVSDDLSDSLFSVNTIAGLPVIEAFANNSVNIGQYTAPPIKVTGSLAIITGSLFGTASYATFAQTPTVTGATGVVGVTGATGVVGVSGATGVVGVSGATGVIGVSGATGPIGVTGATGPVGVTGATGVVGVSGATGVVGVSGATGVVGVSGATGVIGVSGATGITGPVAGSANQVVYKNSSNVAAGSSNLTFNGTTLSAAILDGPVLSGGSSGNLNTDFQNTTANTFKYQGDQASLTNSPGNSWWFYQNMRHSNASNYWGTQVAWGWEDNANRLATRNITGGSFGSWVYYLNSANYNSYAPTLTGGGASGTWGISITGNADTVDSFHASQSTVGNNIVVRDANGYIFGNYLNMSDDGNPGSGTSISSFITKQGDNYYRSVSPTNAMSSIKTVASGTWNIGVSYNAGSVTYLPNRTDGTAYPVLWGAAYTNSIGTVAYSAAAVTITSGTGTLSATNLAATTKVESPIYYNPSTTAYYVNPQSTNRLFKLETFEGVRAGVAFAGEPAYSFWNDTDTGMYNVGANSLGFATAGVKRLEITAAGAMGLGITPTNTSGRFEATNDIVAYSSSDKNWKKNIKNIDSSLEKLSQINGVEFDWIEDEPLHGNKGHDVGVIAQEVELVIPEAVQTRESGMKAVQYDKIIPLLIEAIKELQKQIKELKK